MITLSLLKLLDENGFGTFEEDLLFQEMPLDFTGVYITDIGDPVARGSRDSQSYQLLSRGENNVDGHKRLDEIRKFLANAYGQICELPPVEAYEVEGYMNVTIMKPSTVTSVGLDVNDRMIYSVTGTIIY